MKLSFRAPALLPFFFLAAMGCFAQGQKPKPKTPPKKVEVKIKDSLKVTPGRVVAVLEAAQGWIKSATGKWISSPNRIPFQDPDYNNEFYEKEKIGTENFKQIRVMEIKVDAKLYYAVIVQLTKGYYKDIEKNQDWHYFTAADYYLIEKSHFKKLYNDSMKMGVPYTANLRSYYSGTVPYQNVGQLGPRIGKDINTNIITRHLYDTTVHTFLQFLVKPVKDKRGKFIRFNMTLAYRQNGAAPPDGDYSVFDSQFYELPLERFRVFAKGK